MMSTSMWWPLMSFLLVAIVQVSEAVKGEFITTAILRDKRLPSPILDSPATSLKECERRCYRHLTCDAFSFSHFQQKCLLNKMQLGLKYVIDNGYVLYVKAKSAADGYLVFKDFYIKFGHGMKTYENARAECIKENGDLINIENKELNDELVKYMVNMVMPEAYIGLTDENKEGEWVWGNGAPAKFTQWNWRGMWHREDKNCATTSITGDWFQTDCYDEKRWICQIPIF